MTFSFNEDFNQATVVLWIKATSTSVNVERKTDAIVAKAG